MKTITIDNVDRLQHVAISRLTLAVLGGIHELLYPFQAWLATEIRQSADDDGNVTSSKLAGLLPAAEGKWRVVMDGYIALLTKAREQAADIAFRSLLVHHNAYILEPIERVQEAFVPVSADWRQLAEMWVRRRNYALQQAQQRVWGDGLHLSQRVWRLDTQTFNQLRGTVASGMANRTSAWRLAHDVEQYLGADQDMPRWTYKRLSQLTPVERAQDMTGLLRDPARRTDGVAYNALRLARTELQYANHAVTTDIAVHSPWVTGRYVRMSPQHPAIDVCDEWSSGGPYDKAMEILPLHPQCMCYYEEALMPPKDFAKQVTGWVNGENSFLDDYAAWLGMRALAPIPDSISIADVMDLWMNDSTDAQADVLKLGGQGEN